MDKCSSFQKLFGNVVKLHFLTANKALAEYGIHPGQVEFLMTLYKKDGIIQKELSKKLNIKPSTITVMVQRLTKAGMIYKVIDKTDLRTSRIFLTNDGLNACEKIKIIVKNMENLSLLNFSEEEKNNLIYLLNKIKLNLENNL
ncbi:MarR family winged helix-turn-helix transcriptional regulator [Clostridium niameyense]|uniref:MarR family winged helix-turn-helix transcriptional regulator n=1 Tax=Clostridium niameyense TaxID=1622073 RepID=UPI00067E8691|nr:MarR family transcriptional regulator [Clostridium niameyense]